MNIRDYTQAALTFDTHTDAGLPDALIHGLSTEVAEVLEAACGNDPAAVLSELGDVQWNLALIALAWGIPYSELEEAEQERCKAFVPTKPMLAATLVVQAGKVAGCREKWHRVNRVSPMWEETKAAVVLTWQRLTWLAWVSGYTMDEVRQHNLDKLTARYEELGIPRKGAA